MRIAKNTMVKKELVDSKLIKFIKNRRFLAVICGVVTGLVNGLFGGGGGMIVVPFLLFVLNYETKSAHATAILIILPLSVVSTLIYATFKTLSLNIALPVSIGVTIGGLIGAFLLSKLSSKWVVIIFSLIMMVAGGKMLLF